MLATSQAADVVPNEIKQPGSQPEDGINLESPDKCDNCHGGYDAARVYSNEPAFGWRGSAMGNAGRDPIFWATLAIAEQDFDGSGDLCIRCHSSGGWFAGRSTPTDGSGLAASDDNGIDCDTCHKATNPDNSEHLGVMNAPFVANDAGSGEGYYGSGILSMWNGADKLGPYSDAEARHQFMQSQFHRGDICGSCHDVSNPAVGDLAPNNGIQPWADLIVSSGGNLGGPIEEKAAFNNPPYRYGIVERTFSEWRSGALDTMSVMEFPNLPSELQAGHGALRMAYDSAMLAGGTYADGATRNFSCQSCHMRPDVGEGCNKNVQTRNDLPKHDLTGGNYWVWPLIKYQDQQGTLRLGGGLTQTQIEAMDAGQKRGEDQLGMAADLAVNGNDVTITNLTGHKLITGYPEGRRMWLNVKWYDGTGTLVREDGAYGPLPTSFVNPVDGTTFVPESILDLHDPNTKIYEVHPAITQGWANTLITVNSGVYSPIVLGYDRITGDPVGTIGELASGTLGNYVETFHFVLNNHVAKDNRIPPYGMECEEARKRNALPVPPDQYGGPTTPAAGCSEIYEHWDTITLSPPAAAVGADITLYYQGTSWEYVQFLYLANNGQNAFLGQEGDNFLDAWLNADPAKPMVPPFAMATATWGDPGGCTPTEDPEVTCDDGVDNDCDGLVDGADPDCASTCTPTEDPEVTCDDGVDNDCDGLIDGDDPDCQTSATCTDLPDKGTCSNTPGCEWVGNPKNGSCQDSIPCVPEAEVCTDGVDNDCDGLVDCADTVDCGEEPVCQVSCSDFTTRNLCNAQATCRWDSKAKTCVPN
jgi:hypothetical protein